MLTVHYLNKSYDLQVLFENVSFTLNPGERIGLVGPNGCGKTTLLRILAGKEAPSNGNVSRDPALRIGYLPQGFEPDPNAALGRIIGEAAGAPDALEAELAAVATGLSAAALTLGEKLVLETRYDELLRRIQSAESGRTAAILAGLGLHGIDPDLPAGRLSGGQKTRLSLALVLLGEPQLLLLDEPTNHLDIAMLEWLEDWLKAYPGGVLIVSHDRTFLDHTVTQILDMDPQQHTVRVYAGNYSDYLEQKQAEYDRQWSAFKDQQQEIRQMKQDIARTRAQAEYTERQASSIRIGGPEMKNKGFKDYEQGIAKKVAKKAKAREKKLERFMEDDDRVEKPRRSWQMRIEFAEPPHLGRSVIRTDRLAIGYQLDAPLVKDLNLDVRSGQRIAITGPNGGGKTTLFRTILDEVPPLAGEVQLGPTVRLGYMSQDQSDLDLNLTAVETILDHFQNQTEARSFLAYYLFTGDEPLKPVSLLSYGQRSRLMLARLAARQCNCLLLDEPINHLDIPSRTQFEQALAQFEGAILAVVHDRYFIDRFADEVWWVEGGTVKVQFAS
jgi:ATP-binding cassette, subfamily F, member 3